jgi:WG containing repeat
MKFSFFTLLCFSNICLAQKTVDFDDYLYSTNEGQICLQNGRFGITIDTLGNIIGPKVTTYRNTRFAFPNNLYLDYDETLQGFAFLNSQGKQLTKYIYSNVLFSDGVFCVDKEIGKSKDPFGFNVFKVNQKVVIDLNLKELFLFPKEYNDLNLNEFDYVFNEGLCPYENYQIPFYKNKFRIGFINKFGKQVIQPKYLKAGAFSEGLAAVLGLDVNSRERWGFINKSGELVIPYKYKYQPIPFSDGISLVAEDGSDGKVFGGINKKGDVVIEFQENEFPPFKNRITVLQGKSYDKAILVNNKGETLKKIENIYLSNPEDYSKKPVERINPCFNRYCLLNTLYSLKGDEIFSIPHFNELGISKITPFDLLYFKNFAGETGFMNIKGEKIIIAKKR